MALAVSPGTFGPILWPWVHLQAKRLDVMRSLDARLKAVGKAPMFTREREALHRWLSDLAFFTPCDKCAGHHNAFVAAHPVPANDDAAGTSDPNNKTDQRFFAWSVAAHNHANQQTGARQFSVEEAEASLARSWYPDPKEAAAGRTNAWSTRSREDDAKRITQLEVDNFNGRRAHERTDRTVIGLITALTVVGSLLLFVCGYIAYVSWRTRHPVTAQSPQSPQQGRSTVASVA